MLSLFQIRPLQGKGQGVFATSIIPSGTTIMQDRKIMRSPQSNRSVFSHATETEVERAFNGMSRHNQERYLAMSTGGATNNDPQEKAERTGPLERDSYHTTGRESTDNKQKLLDIYRANAFGEDGGGEKYMFFDICRINHACVPNAELLNQGDEGVADGGLETVVALQTIDKGEEITICYNMLFCRMTRVQRKAYARRVWGFECGCAGCLPPTRPDAVSTTYGLRTGRGGMGMSMSMSEARRTLINSLVSRLEGRSAPDWTILLGLRSTIPTPKQPPIDIISPLPLSPAQQTTALNVLLASLLLAENLAGTTVLNAYTTATMTLMKQIEADPAVEGDGEGDGVYVQVACRFAKKWMQLSMKHGAHVRGTLSQETMGWKKAWEGRVQRSGRLREGFAAVDGAKEDRIKRGLRW
ncbi:SET domain-containing protein 5 [Recurvomyces mirabilis]|uniref:SET domain-containing protein 5 n=1 Tax=Recurvomyces mirabilis TaxID=574656 RepID=A0AAE0TUX1_9PEZI|nr:SET domain-containing protein 5 [Recurvomyces mirabilis]KAK5156494.1 hypothetical protein LTS14_004705 [Recurvomyces mirabilis]